MPVCSFFWLNCRTDLGLNGSFLEDQCTCADLFLSPAFSSIRCLCREAVVHQCCCTWVRGCGGRVERIDQERRVLFRSPTFLLMCRPGCVCHTHAFLGSSWGSWGFFQFVGILYYSSCQATDCPRESKKNSSYLTGDQRMFILESDISDHCPGTQTQDTTSFMFPRGNSWRVFFYSSKTMEIINQNTFSDTLMGTLEVI